MTTHHYNRWTFKASRLAHMETCKIEDADVFHRVGVSGELGFLRLLSNWNRVSARGFETTGILYIYHPEYPK
ncbi:MAG: hypothetical protein EOR25_15585 [Mesorhizobium sp.]|uniref:hypothetical protein n=1 Tax=Mesorhizobium sp. TaxID=1871066 RepID=UPI000FE31E48|nr:hypothetical protein [Mesorhizobium sp.]RWH50268.1 MAG: hypothetical protein EOQ80_04670 [Mesorhizobium sp.]RWI47572.1 MAG: hypothetical protein EOR15_13915 [Mesorhizobium sp.]RWI88206.1 MAG: hypothetical protein EOR20_03970 [Mesorhizobium sp.]RWJ09654.1 MAG: hypothetical protein EOR24_18385 [Mesorhizobium sp.]RWJ16313.1 MAG: hypothetical protein EOR25_15585 [Mesorhizobium sp.]